MARHHRRAARSAALILAAAPLLLGACAGFDTVGDGAGSRYLAVYRPFASCADLESWTRDALRPRVTAWGIGGGWGGPLVGVARGEAVASADATTASGASTSTTVQEAGIDEGDLAENDGRYAYAAVGERLRVVDTVSGALVHEQTIPVGDHQLVLAADTPGKGRLILVTNRWDGGEPETLVRRYDVTGGIPAADGVDHLEGSLVAVRAVDGVVHVVVRHDATRRLPFVAPVNPGPDAEKTALERNLRIVDELRADDVLPRSYRVGTDGVATPARAALACEDVGTPGEHSGFGVTWVATIPLDGDSGTRAGAGVVADAEHAYASATSLYVATVAHPEVGGDVAPIRPEPVRTSIHRFDLTGDGASYRASGDVAGRIVSPYSLSEHRGLLRVATTTDDAGFGSQSESGVRVLETSGEELAQIADISGLGRGEQIQGVRFSGDLAFVVTFRQIDPLYVIDLADPRAPRLRGELKIPGFSTWLLPLPEGRLLAFGRSGTDDGAVTGVQWSLFDVTDLDTPTLTATLDAGENSEAAWDPRALAFEPATGLLLTPGETWSNVAPMPAPMPEPVPDPATDPGATVTDERRSAPPTGAVTGEVLTSSWYVNVGRIDGTGLVDVGRVALPSPGRRTMLVGGRIVSVNADGSVTIADGDTLAVLVNLP